METKWLILIGWTLWAVAPGSQGLPYKIFRTPGGYYCARGECFYDIDKTRTSLTATRISIYNVTGSGPKKTLVSVSLNRSDVFIEPTRRDDVNGTGNVTAYHADVTFFVRREADCQRGKFECSIEFVDPSGQTIEYHETLSPPVLNSDCTCVWVKGKSTFILHRSSKIVAGLDNQKERSGLHGNATVALRHVYNVNDQRIARLRVDTTFLERKLQVLERDEDVAEEMIRELRVNDRDTERGLTEMRENDTVLGEALTELKHKMEVRDGDINKMSQRDSELKKSKINGLCRSYEESQKNINEIRRKNEDMENEITSVKHIGTEIAGNLSTLSIHDVNRRDRINSMRLNETFQDEALVEMRRKHVGIEEKIKEAKRNNTLLDEVINGVKHNDSINEAEIKRLRLTDASIVKGLGGLTRDDKAMDEELDVLKESDNGRDEQILVLIANDTILQEQIDSIRRNNSIIHNSTTSLKSNIEVLHSLTAELTKVDTIYKERTKNVGLKYSEMQRMALKLKQQNLVLEATVEILSSKIDSLERFLNSSQMKVVTRASSVKDVAITVESG